MQFLKGILKLNSHLSINTVLWLRFSFGYYFKFTNSLIVNVLGKLYCILCCGIIITYTIIFDDPIFDSDFAGTLYDAVLVTEITANILVSLINEERDLRKFSSDLTLEFPTVKQKYFVVSLTVAILCLSKSFSIVVVDIVKFATIDLFMNIFGFCSFLCGRLTFVCVSDCYQNTVQVLCKSLKEQLNKNNIKDSEKTVYINQFLSSYMKLSKSTSSTITVIRLQTITAFVSEFVRSIFIVYYFNSCASVYLSFTAPWIFEVFLSLFSLFIPLITMETASSYLDDIKKELAIQLLLYKDNSLCEAIHETCEFIDKTKTQYTLWNKFPLNLVLVFSFIKLCTSYIIALLQFTY